MPEEETSGTEVYVDLDALPPEHHPDDHEILAAGLNPDTDEAWMLNMSDEELAKYAAVCTAARVDPACLGCIAEIVMVEQRTTRGGVDLAEPPPPLGVGGQDFEDPDSDPQTFVFAAADPTTADRMLAAVDEIRNLVLPFFSPTHVARSRGLDTAEFATLVTAADSWVRLVTASGLRLDDEQTALVERVRAIVGRIGG